MELRLVVEAHPSWTGPVEELDNRKWMVTELMPTTSVTSPAPAYHCVSYVWGTEESTIMFSLPGSISIRSRGALEAAISCNRDANSRHTGLTRYAFLVVMVLDALHLKVWAISTHKRFQSL